MKIDLLINILDYNLKQNENTRYSVKNSINNLLTDINYISLEDLKTDLNGVKILLKKDLKKLNEFSKFLNSSIDSLSINEIKDLLNILYRYFNS